MRSGGRWRRERDPLGELEVPQEAYYGIQTRRAMENFVVSGRRPKLELIKAYTQVKKACALVNMRLGKLDDVRGKAIVQAAEEVIEGRLSDQFPIDIFQAGGGTSTNMNVNEVLANRALELMGKKKGEYRHLHPNDHVNMSQSSNDTFPTASQIAVIQENDKLVSCLDDLAEAFSAKAKEFRCVVKIGRTHLTDALPVTLGAEMNAYGSAITRAAGRLQERRRSLLEIPLGGTATGGGENAGPLFRRMAIRQLSQQCGLPLRSARDSYEAIQSWSLFVSYSGALKELAVEMTRIANDLRLLGSGPQFGLGEIVLPAVQPGSSIMVGKVNPVMAECLDMISFQVIGNDTTVGLAGQAGQLELNAMGPIIVSNILDSLSYYNNFLPIFQEKCVQGIVSKVDHASLKIWESPILATLLEPRIGYQQAWEVADIARKTGKSLTQVVVEQGILEEEELKSILESHPALSCWAGNPPTRRVRRREKVKTHPLISNSGE